MGESGEPIDDVGGPREQAFDTLIVHAGAEPDELTGAISPPIYQTSTYEQDGVGRPRAGWEYARTGNPTRSRLERAVASLEGGAHGIAFASGAAATATVLDLVRPGDEIVVGDDVYSGTYRLLERVMGERGIQVRYVDLTPGMDTLRTVLTERTRMVWFETPTNPLLKLVDIAAVSEVVAAHRGVDGVPPMVVVDNTFATPALQRPLTLGADIVVHSATKYLGGHSDAISGIVVTSDEAVAERLRFLQNAVGAVPGPFDCFLILRGLRTLGLRMERHCANARAVASFLAVREDVAEVRYPGLASGYNARPHAAIAQMREGGGMVSFVPRGERRRSADERAIRTCEATRLFRLAESLGGVESLVELPAVMTHASVGGSPLEVPRALIRLSVGIESGDDLVADLQRALDHA